MARCKYLIDTRYNWGVLEGRCSFQESLGCRGYYPMSSMCNRCIHND